MSMVFASSQTITSYRINLIKVVTLAVCLSLWEILSRSGLFYAGIMPSIVLVVKALGSELTDRSFYHDLGLTMLESSVGFVFGSILAIALGIMLGISRYFRRMAMPYIVSIGATPKIIFLPIIFLIFGIGIESKMAKGAMSAFFPVVLSTTSGFLLIPPVILRVGESFALSRWQMATKIYFPAMAVPLMTGLRLGIAVSTIGVLAAEITYANAGLGYRLINSAEQYKIPQMYATMILIFVVAGTINWVMTRILAATSRHQRSQASLSALG
ncbi:MAG: ABC transporter permease subunit [Rhizobiaceae bacterium]